MSKRKIAVGIARRILAKRRQMYADAAACELGKKFRFYKLAGWE
jgi:hypothetical protein